MIAEQIEILNLNFKKNHSKCNIKNLNSSGDINSEQHNSRCNSFEEQSTTRSKYNTNRNTHLNYERHANPAIIR